MTNDLIIEIAPDRDNQLRFNLCGATLPESGTPILRPEFTLDPSKLDALRRGNPAPALVQEVHDAVYRWLLDGALEPYLNLLLGEAGTELRLVFAVEQRLQPRLADVPIELVEFNHTPLVLDPHVAGIVHRLPKVGYPEANPNDWPFRVLVVRSNPQDLGGAVPVAEPLCEHIRELAQPFGQCQVQVDLLSQEPTATGAATWENFRTQIRTRNYHVLVFLGHGDLQETYAGLEPVGVLLFETDNGQYHRPVGSDQLKLELQHHPIPVALLAGCLTAAEVHDEEMRELIDEKTPTFMRGSQGVAQALVNSQAGIQLAVGMRYRLESEAAGRFLTAFFASLLNPTEKAGDVEAAIHAGREELFAHEKYPPAWSAPVVFRAPGEEPTFRFLTQSPLVARDPLDERDRLYQTELWNSLIELVQALPDHTRLQPLYDMLDGVEQRLAARAQARGPYVTLQRLEARPGQQVMVNVQLHGDLNIEHLEGRVVVRGAGVRSTSLERLAVLEQNHYRLLVEQPQDGSLAFRIQPARGSQAATLSSGPLFQVALTLGSEPGVCEIDIEVLETQPRVTLQSLPNAVLVCSL